MLKYHTASENSKIAEVEPGSDLITNPGDMLDIIAEAGYNVCDRVIIHENSLHRDFFDLKTGLAGEILQKGNLFRLSGMLFVPFCPIMISAILPKTMIRNLTILFVLLFLSACEIINDLHPTALFEIQYINYAWGYQHSGSIIDASGDIREFDL